MGRNNIVIIALSLVLVVAVAAVAGAQMVCRTGGIRHRGQAMAGRIAARLQLTDAQQKQAREIFQQVKKDTAAVFTPEQREQMTQMRRQYGRMGRMHARRGQLTQEQQEKTQAIRKDAQARIEAVNNEKLTAQERTEKLRAIRQSAMEQMRQVFGAGQQRDQQRPAQRLQLTDEQKAQLKSIREKAREQFRAILTPEQQQQLDGMREQMRQPAK